MAGKSAVSLTAKGLAAPLPMPVSAEKYFAIDSRVVVQLFNDETPQCWSSEFTSASKNSPTQFSAKLP